MAETFTQRDKDAAYAEGWMLVPVYDTRGYFSQMVCPVANNLTPFDAHRVVWESAKRGDARARRAMTIIAHAEITGKAQAAKKRGKR